MGPPDRRLRLADAERRALGDRPRERDAASRAPPAGTTLATTPQASASAADSRRPVRITSRARAGPTSHVSVCVDPPPGKIPTLTSGNPKVAPAPATIRSQASASSNPPPSATPSTAAIVGIGSSWRRRISPTISDRCARRSSSEKPARSLRSIPAQNARSPAAPTMTTAHAGVRLDPVERRVERGQHGVVDRVHHRRPIERQHGQHARLVVQRHAVDAQGRRPGIAHRTSIGHGSAVTRSSRCS